MIRIAEKLKEEKYRIIAFIACVIITMIIEYFYKDAEWLYDVDDYWHRGNVLKANNFRLWSIQGYRGYIYPLYLGITDAIGGRVAWFRINALMISTLVVWILPDIQSYREKNSMEIVKIIVLMLAINVLFLGLVVYPLSDMFGVLMMSIAIFFMKRSIETKCECISYLCALFMGGFCYLAYNTRTIYLFAGIVAGMLYIILTFIYKQGGIIKKGILCILKCVVGSVGVLVAALPQYYMNFQNSRIKSIAVPTNGLMQSQLFWGLQYQRYDTYLNYLTDEVHSFPNVFFIDNIGLEILKEAQMTSLKGTETFSDYFRIVINHPLDVLLIYVRHFINYIFPCWPQIYIYDLNNCKWILGLIAITIFFIAISAYFFKCYKNTKGLVYFIPLLVPAICIIPGAVEYRFSIPIYICVLCQLCFNINYKQYFSIIIAEKRKILVIYVTLIVLIFTIWGGMLASEWKTPLFLN